MKATYFQAGVATVAAAASMLSWRTLEAAAASELPAAEVASSPAATLLSCALVEAECCDAAEELPSLPPEVVAGGVAAEGWGDLVRERGPAVR